VAETNQVKFDIDTEGWAEASSVPML